jgi:hypothetical protein
MRLAVVIASLMLVSSSSFAQIIYEPIRYQYSANGSLYYYGGSDPAMHRYARSAVDAGGSWGRISGFDFVAGDIDRHREVAFDRPVRVFNDAVGYQNAKFYGYTPTDAANDAYASAPRYFRKADLLASARQDATGAWIVPAQAPTRATGGTIEIKPFVRPRAHVAPRPIIIITKDLLDRPLKPSSEKSVAVVE